MSMLKYSCLLVLLGACAAPQPDTPFEPTRKAADAVESAEQNVDVSLAPAAVLKQYFDAVAAQDLDAAFATGTTAWAQREREWEQGFTHAFFHDGLRVQDWRITSMDVNDRDQLEARVRAVLLREGEEPDGEGMRFTLEEYPDGWKIVDLK